MSRSRIIAAVLGIFSFNAMTLDASSAASFEERWSPVPKAHAEPNPPPDSQPSSRTTKQPEAQPSPSTQNRVGKKSHQARTASTRRAQTNRGLSGRASFYSYRGGKTASGAAFDREGLTAAHRTLPFGTRLRVTDVSTGKSVQVVVTDRGPAAKNRILDLSLGAARALQVGDRGVIQVHANVVSRPGSAVR